MRVPFVPHLCQHLAASVLGLGHISRYVLVSIWICNFLMTYDVKHIFLFLFAFYISSFVKFLFIFLSTLWVIFLLLNFKRVFFFFCIIWIIVLPVLTPVKASASRKLWFLIAASIFSLEQRLTLWPQFSNGCKKNCWFSIFSAFFSCFKDEKGGLQSFYMSDLKQEVQYFF